LFELAKPQIKIADLKRRIALCTQNDVVTENGMMVLSRNPVTWVWARIDDALNLPSFQSTAGYSFKESYNAWKTHRIIIRSRTWLELSSMAWIYEERLKTSPRWYKYLGFDDADEWILLSTHLIERSPDVLPPINNILQPQPSNVRL
jgi:hypothetical protein